MTTEETSKKHTLRLSPWLVAGIALVLYALTLNHWVTLSSLPWVAKVTGWDWHPTNLAWRPTFIAPLYYAITYPFRLLPISAQPFALNFLSAVFAALTLATLVRSIRLLPHDRTREQRQREGGEFSLLSGSFAWLPPVLAVLALGLEMTFWENATMATSEMLDLFIFAYLIRCLLEYRISQDESWITKFVFIYGLGMTNNWALIGFFPFFLGALIWIKGVSFFNWRFLGRCVGFGLLGLLPYLIMAFIASHAYAGGTFWSQLHAHLVQQRNAVLGFPRSPAIVLSIPAVLALIFAGIRWPSFHGEVSAAGIMFTNLIFRLVHIVFFAFAVVYFFDFKYSPRALQPLTSMLTFYYLAALSIGYFTGYILLVFGQPPAKVREHTPGVLRGVKLLIFALPWVALVAIPVGLLFGLPYKVREGNWQHIQAGRAPVAKDFAVATAKSLPSNTAVVLGDDISRVELAKAGWQLVHNSAGPVFVETGGLAVGEYVRYLASHYPQFNQAIRDQSSIPKYYRPLGEIQILQALPKPIYYLEPSFGAFFERFYLQPAGMVFQLTSLEPHVLIPPALTDTEVAANMNAWNQIMGSSVSNLPRLAKNNADAATIAAQMSRAANYLGVVLERQNHLKEANTAFSYALTMNPKNVMARINQDFNANLRAGNTKSIELGEDFFEESKRLGLQGLLAIDGPTDDPSLGLQFGQGIAGGGFLRQASEYFVRVLALRPNDVDAQLALAKTYVDMDNVDEGLKMVQKARTHATAANADEITRVEALAYMAKQDFDRAEGLLKTAAAKNDAGTGSRLGMLAEFYRVRGYNDLRAKRTTEAKAHFNSALATLDQQLRWYAAPERVHSSEPETAEVLMRKSEIQMQLGAYDAAIASLDKALDLQSENPRALMNRAIAKLQAGKYDDAKHDYQQLEKLLPTPNYAVYYGLGEVASKTNDRSGAIRNFKKYLKYAPENSDEAKQVRERLQKLEHGA
jgi:tetratricopeptide (TPR) repeat protein